MIKLKKTMFIAILAFGSLNLVSYADTCFEGACVKITTCTFGDCITVKVCANKIC